MEQTGKFQNMCNTNLADDVVISKVVQKVVHGVWSHSKIISATFSDTKKDFFNHPHSTLQMCIRLMPLTLVHIFLNCPLGLGLYYNPLYNIYLVCLYLV